MVRYETANHYRVLNILITFPLAVYQNNMILEVEAEVKFYIEIILVWGSLGDLDCYWNFKEPNWLSKVIYDLFRKQEKVSYIILSWKKDTTVCISLKCRNKPQSCVNFSWNWPSIILENYSYAN